MGDVRKESHCQGHTGTVHQCLRPPGWGREIEAGVEGGGGLGCDWTHTAAAQYLWPLTSVGAVPGRWVTDDGGSSRVSCRGAAEDTLTGPSSAGHTSPQSQASLIPWQTPRVCVWHPDLASGSVILMNRCEHTHTHAHTHGCMPTGILTCTHTLMHTHTNVYTQTHEHAHTHKLTHVFMRASGHTYAFTYTHMLSKHMVLTSR